ncbi:MAG: bifunctional nuclease family protein [Halobacteriales archaeon]|nr:bifunctional nuclease family protein [Halobacteriales archaeon]
MEHPATVQGVGLTVDDEALSTPVVVLSARDAYLPIYVTTDQARAIHLARTGTPAERPLTHDLLLEMVTDFGGAVDRVRIDDLADGTFYAKVDAERYEDGEREAYVFDARPSDGIAIAVRADCPIVVTDEVLDAAGQPPEAFEIDQYGGPGPREE